MLLLIDLLFDYEKYEHRRMFVSGEDVVHFGHPLTTTRILRCLERLDVVKSLVLLASK